MDTLVSLLGVGASVASGGLFGVLGSAVGMFFKWRQKKLDLEERALDRAHELKLIELQMKGRAEETEQELAIAQQTGSWEGLATSVRADSMLGPSTHIWVNDVKSLFRPFLTTGLWVCTAWIFSMILDESTILLLKDQSPWLQDLIKYMIYSVVFATSGATMWWFGDRAFAPAGLKNA